MHAVALADAELTSTRGCAEALCGYLISSSSVTFEDGPRGTLCLPCVIGATSDLPDPGRFGTAI